MKPQYSPRAIDARYWASKTNEMNTNCYGHLGPAIAASPWTLPVSKRNQRVKLEYCERNARLVTDQILKPGNDKDLLAQLCEQVILWDNRKQWVKAGRL